MNPGELTADGNLQQEEEKKEEVSLQERIRILAHFLDVPEKMRERQEKQAYTAAVNTFITETCSDLSLSKKEIQQITNQFVTTLTTAKGRDVIMPAQIASMLEKAYPEGNKAAFNKITEAFAVNEELQKHTAHIVKKFKVHVAAEKIDPIALRSTTFDTFEVGFAERLRKAAEKETQRTLNTDEIKLLKNAVGIYVHEQRDAVFQEPKTSIDALLTRFPQLTTLINGALIAKAQDEQAIANATLYKKSLDAFETDDAFKKQQIAEKIEVLEGHYAMSLKDANIPDEIKKQKIAQFHAAAVATLSTPQQPNISLFETIQKKMVVDSPTTYEDIGGAWKHTKHELRSNGLENSYMQQLQETRTNYLTRASRLIQLIKQQQAMEQTIATTSRFPAAAEAAENAAAGIAKGAGTLFDWGSRAFSAGRTGAAVAEGAGAVTAAATWEVWAIVGVIVVVVGILIIIIYQVAIAPASTDKEPFPLIADVPRQQVVPSSGAVPTTAAVPPDVIVPVIPPGSIPIGYGKKGDTFATMVPSWEEKTPLPIAGYFTWYGSPGMMDNSMRLQIKNGHISDADIKNCPNYVGKIAMLRKGDFGRCLWIGRSNNEVIGPFLVVDVSSSRHVTSNINRSIGNDRWVADLSWETVHYTFGGKSEHIIIYDKKPE